MKPTAMFTLCWLDGEGRVERNLKYIWYYRKLKKILGFERFVLADNASSSASMKKFLDGLIDTSDVHFIRYDEHLARRGGFDYPYCWRGMEALKIVTDRYDKVFCIDSDYFICTERLANYLRDCNTGWEALWSFKYQFPEAACHVLNKDSFHIIKNEPDWMKWNGKVMETSLPFTSICRDFNTDRYGEQNLEQTKTVDAYGQCPLERGIIYEKFKT